MYGGRHVVLQEADIATLKLLPVTSKLGKSRPQCSAHSVALERTWNWLDASISSCGKQASPMFNFDYSLLVYGQRILNGRLFTVDCRISARNRAQARIIVQAGVPDSTG